MTHAKGGVRLIFLYVVYHPPYCIPPGVVLFLLIERNNVITEGSILQYVIYGMSLPLLTPPYHHFP